MGKRIPRRVAGGTITKTKTKKRSLSLSFSHHGRRRSRDGRYSQRIWNIQNRRDLRFTEREKVAHHRTDYQVRARERPSREPSREDAGSDHGVGVLHGLEEERRE